MNLPFEYVSPNEGQSFRVLHQNVHPNTFEWDYHFHPELELVYVFEGTGRRHVGNHISYYQDGDFVFVGANVPHSGFGYGSIDNHEEVVIQFRKDFMGATFFQAPEFSSIVRLIELSQQGIAFNGNVKKQASEMFRDFLTLPPLERFLKLFQILQFLATSSEYELLNPIETSYDFSIKDQIRLKKVFQYVEQNFQRTIQTPEVAELSNLTVPAFCNYFKKYMNTNFTDFLNEYRINQACKQLADGNKNISDICFDCGFSSISYFSRTFKRFKEISPREYSALVNRRITPMANTALR